MNVSRPIRARIFPAAIQHNYRVAKAKAPDSRAWAVIKAFLAVVTRYGFAPFAWYRIIVGVAALAWLAAR